ncbi:MAG: hypothetical protein IPO12_16980 [Flavobacteriales bacterium]|nr:hypothetical protein [Flavobacteriales bacterium]
MTAPQHTYQTTGNFIVTLTAFDPRLVQRRRPVSFTVTVLGAAPALEAMNDTLWPLASFTLTASGTGDVNAWQWSSNADFSDMLNSSPSDSTALIQPAVSGTWYVQGSTSGCASVDSVVIEVSLANIAIGPDQEICADEQAQLQLSGVDPGSTIVWTPSSKDRRARHRDRYRGSRRNARLPGGCDNARRLHMDRDQHRVRFSRERQRSDGNRGSADRGGRDHRATAGRTFNWCDLSWLPADGVSDQDIANPTAVVNVTTWFVATVSDGICTKIDSVLVTVYELNCSDPDIYVPNAFSPNADGSNEVLFVRGRFIAEMDFRSSTDGANWCSRRRSRSDGTALTTASP